MAHSTGLKCDGFPVFQNQPWLIYGAFVAAGKAVGPKCAFDGREIAFDGSGVGFGMDNAFDAASLAKTAAARLVAGGAGDADGGGRGALLLAGQCRERGRRRAVMLVSRLAVHTKNILADPRVSLMLDERSAGRSARRRAHHGDGTAVAVSDEATKARYLARHPSAARFAQFRRFLLLRASRRRRCISLPVSAASPTLSRRDFLTDLAGRRKAGRGRGRRGGPFEPGPRRDVVSVCPETMQSAYRRVALRRLRSGGPRHAMRQPDHSGWLFRTG